MTATMYCAVRSSETCRQLLAHVPLMVLVLVLLVAVPPPSMAQTYTVLHMFTSKPDGASPNAALIRDAAGNLYGTTVFGGANGLGSVFKVYPTGNLTVLYSFAGGTTGAYPYSALIRDGAGNLYGTASHAGNSQGVITCGVVFKVDPKGNETVLYKFKGSPDGCAPFARLMQDAAGNLYGTTIAGGTGSCPPNPGCGTVFKLDTTGTETVLHSFAGGTDGAFPLAGVVGDAAGNLYGTTREGGGTNNAGIVFKLDKTGSEAVLRSLAYTDGAFPSGDLLRDAAGNLYGATTAGGTSGRGTLFKIDAAGNDTVLFSFPGGAGGNQPNGGLVRDAVGNLYGTTYGGTSPCVNPGDCGVIFKVDTTGTETVLHTLKGSSGAWPAAGLVRDGTGNLYGTTVNGGVKYGVVFKLTLPNFKIKESPTLATVSPGQSTTSTLTITPVAGFAGTVTLSCTVPSGDGLSCDVSPASVTLGGVDSETANLTIDTSSTTAAATYQVKVAGVSEATHHCATFRLTVQ